MEVWRLSLWLSEKPAVGTVSIAGNKKISEEDIREVLDTRGFTVLNPVSIKKNIRKIRDLYLDKGFFLADIQSELTWLDDDRVDLTFQIQENKKVIVQRIDFSGNVNVSDKKIKRFMQTKAGGLLPWLTSSGTFKKEQLDSDLQAIRYVFWEEGYINAVIQAPEVFLSPDKRFIFISFRIDEGERYDIGDVSVSGDFNADEGLTEEAVLALTKGRPAFSIQEEQWRTFVGKSGAGPSPKKGAAKLVSGEPFKASQMELVRMSIESLYQEQGYAFANVEMVLTPREGEM